METRSHRIKKLSSEDIEEELVNEDLKELGVSDDLSNMDFQEKKHLLSAIKASAETSSSVGISDEKDNKLTESDPLVVDTRANNSSPSSDILETEISSSQAKKYLTNNNLQNQRPKKQFCLPFCNDTDVPPLTLPDDCPIMLSKNKNIEVSFQEEVRQMIEEHDAWKKGYLKALSQLKISQQNKDSPRIIDEDGNTNQSSPKVEDDIYAFISEESCTVTSKHTDEVMQTNEDHLKEITSENTSKESCSMVDGQFEDNILKSPQLSPYTLSSDDSTTFVSTRRRKNRNNAETRSVEFQSNFKEKLNSQTNAWEQTRVQSRSSGRNQRTDKTKENPVTEMKVQCPICQQDFLQSKIENHAAECNGFFIEETAEKSETRETETVQNTMRNRRGGNKRGN